MKRTQYNYDPFFISGKKNKQCSICFEVLEEKIETERRFDECYDCRQGLRPYSHSTGNCTCEVYDLDIKTFFCKNCKTRENCICEICNKETNHFGDIIFYKNLKYCDSCFRNKYDLSDNDTIYDYDYYTFKSGYKYYKNTFKYNPIWNIKFQRNLTNCKNCKENFYTIEIENDSCKSQKKPKWQKTKIESLKNLCKQCFNHQKEKEIAAYKLQNEDPTNEMYLYDFDEDNFCWNKIKFKKTCPSCKYTISLPLYYLKENIKENKTQHCFECNPSNYFHKYVWYKLKQYYPHPIETGGYWKIDKVRVFSGNRHIWRNPTSKFHEEYLCNCKKCEKILNF